MPTEDIATAVQPTAPSATKDEQKTEHMIPQSRLNEVLEQNHKLQERLETAEKERKEQLEAQLAEQGKWKEIAEQRAQELAGLKPKAEQVEEYETVLKEQLASEIESLPEEYRDVVPDSLSTKDQLRWLAKNKSKFMKAEPPDIGAGKRGSKPDKSVTLSDDEKRIAKHFGMSDEDYAKYKENQ